MKLMLVWSYTVKISRPAEKFLRALTDQKLYRRLRDALDGSEKNPRPQSSVKLEGGDELFRVRVGHDRIVDQIQDRQLIVLVVQLEHRREFIASRR